MVRGTLSWIDRKRASPKRTIRSIGRLRLVIVLGRLTNSCLEMKLLPCAPVSSKPGVKLIGSLSVTMVPARMKGWHSVCEDEDVDVAAAS